MHTAGLTPRTPPKSSDKTSEVHVPSLFHQAARHTAKLTLGSAPQPPTPPAGAGFVPPARPAGGGAGSAGFPSCCTALSNGAPAPELGTPDKDGHSAMLHTFNFTFGIKLFAA